MLPPCSVAERTLSGKVCAVTGANAGLGLCLSHQLAKRGATLYMLCRNEERGAAAVQEVKQATGNQDVHLKVCCRAVYEDQRQCNELLEQQQQLQQWHQQQHEHGMEGLYTRAAVISVMCAQCSGNLKSSSTISAAWLHGTLTSSKQRVFTLGWLDSGSSCTNSNVSRVSICICSCNDMPERMCRLHFVGQVDALRLVVEQAGRSCHRDPGRPIPRPDHSCHTEQPLYCYFTAFKS